MTINLQSYIFLQHSTFSLLSLIGLCFVIFGPIFIHSKINILNFNQIYFLISSYFVTKIYVFKNIYIFYY